MSQIFSLGAVSPADLAIRQPARRTVRPASGPRELAPLVFDFDRCLIYVTAEPDRLFAAMERLFQRRLYGRIELTIMPAISRDSWRINPVNACASSGISAYLRPLANSAFRRACKPIAGADSTFRSKMAVRGELFLAYFRTRGILQLDPKV